MSRIDSIFPTSAMRCLLCALALCTATGVMAKSLPCAPGVTPWLSLTITAGTVIAVSDRIISVRVHDNGCVELHRPAFYRRAGDYRLQLSKPELAALRGKNIAEQLRAFDAGKVRVALAKSHAAGAKSDSAAPEDFAVLDADHFLLAADESGKRAAAAWPGLHVYAEFYPEVLELKQLSVLVRTVQALLAREDGVRVQGAAP